MKAANQLLGKRAARALGQNHDLGFQIVAGLEIGFLLAVLVYAFVVGAYARHASGIEQQLGAGESSEDGNPRLFHFAAQPLYELVNRNDIVAVIAHGRRRDGKLEFAGAREVVNGFLDHLGVQRSFLLEVGQQLAHGTRIEQRSGEAMRTYFASFFQEVDVLLGELGLRDSWRCAHR